jgi:hypothetical protein
MESRRCRATALVIVALLATSCGAPSPKSTHTSPVASSLAARPSPTPSPTPTIALRPCAQQDLAASFEGWGAATGKVGGTFRLTPTSTDGLCGLPGRPAVRFVDERNNPLLSFASPEAQTTWAPVRVGAGKDATFVHLQWSNHGGEPTYRCANRTAAVAALEIELPSWRVALTFPPQKQPTFCADPEELVFVEVIAR